MRSRDAGLAALSFAMAAAVTAAGCHRSPFGTSGDAGRDAAIGAPSVGDAARETTEIATDAPADAASNDPARADAPPDDAPTPDAASDDSSPHDAAASDGPPIDTPLRDALPSDDAFPDAPASDIGPIDAPPADAAGDRIDAPIDALPDGPTSDARPEDQPCGPLAFNCAPFACDVALGICKSHCTTNADCVTGKTCTSIGLCGFREDTICAANAECASGFCAQGVCCATACTGSCRSCALPGSIGTCAPVARGSLDPIGVCGTDATCNGRGGCVPATCVADTDCGELYWCTAGRCVPCNATCVSSAECIAGAACFTRNACSYCSPADAGA